MNTDSLPPAPGSHRRTAGARSSVRPRAIAGVALCAFAALGLWWAVEQSAAVPETSYVVARTRLAPGRVIEASDVALVSIRLPAEVSATVFGDGDGGADDVIGNVVVDAIHAGELLTRGDIGSRQSADGGETGYAIAVELNRPQALNGLLAAGERVDVVVTDRDRLEAAGVIAASALVLDVDDLSEADRLSDTITVTLQVHDRAAAVSVAAAAEVSAITLIRAWGSSP